MYCYITCIVLNCKEVNPIGTAVSDTRSLTSYTTILTIASCVRPSLARNSTVFEKLGLLHVYKKSNFYRTINLLSI